jgi:hypothetical protein
MAEKKTLESETFNEPNTNKFNEPFKEKPNTTVNVTSGAFPLSLWCEWDKDCKENFGDCRWMKMWHDHQMSLKFDIFAVIMDEISELREVVRELASKHTEAKKEKVKTLGGVAKE